MKVVGINQKAKKLKTKFYGDDPENPTKFFTGGFYRTSRICKKGETLEEAFDREMAEDGWYPLKDKNVFVEMSVRITRHSEMGVSFYDVDTNECYCLDDRCAKILVCLLVANQLEIVDRDTFKGYFTLTSTPAHYYLKPVAKNEVKFFEEG